MQLFYQKTEPFKFDLKKQNKIKIKTKESIFFLDFLFYERLKFKFYCRKFDEKYIIIHCSFKIENKNWSNVIYNSN